MLPVRKLFLAAVFVARASVDAHAILSSPIPRAGTNTGTGIKLQPFADARTIANSGCGGISNKDPGTTVPTTTYQSGATIEVEWKLTIPHPADNLLNGVRVALHVSATDSFDQNILAGGAEGDPPYTKVPAGDDGDASNAVKTVTVTLPAGKTCDLCTLQWMWSAQNDGGSYIGCADVSITANGQPPTATPVPVQGEVLAGVPGEVLVATPPPPPNGIPAAGSYPPPPPLGAVGEELDSPEKSGGISGMTMAGILIVLALAYGGYSFNKAKKEAEAKGVTLTAGEWAKTESEKVKAKVQAEMEKRKKPKGAAGKAPTAMAAVPPPAPGGAGYTAPAPLPEGWKEMQDENSGRPYFYNTRTGSSAWVRPES